MSLAFLCLEGVAWNLERNLRYKAKTIYGGLPEENSYTTLGDLGTLRRDAIDSKKNNHSTSKIAKALKAS